LILVYKLHDTSSTNKETEKSLSGYITRTRILFDPLTAPEAGEIFQLKSASISEAQILPPIELVKPSARFGLLLVAGSDM
jgi:hypothetical protein